MKYKLFRAVKLPEDIVRQVELNKKKTGVPISVFFTQAAQEKLNKINDYSGVNTYDKDDKL